MTTVGADDGVAFGVGGFAASEMAGAAATGVGVVAAAAEADAADAATAPPEAAESSFAS